MRNIITVSDLNVSYQRYSIKTNIPRAVRATELNSVLINFTFRFSIDFGEICEYVKSISRKNPVDCQRRNTIVATDTLQINGLYGFVLRRINTMERI